jgi:hypothetical protein
MTDIESTPQTTSQPQSLVRRRWPTLVGLGFAALVALDLVSGVELAPVLAASAAVYLLAPEEVGLEVTVDLQKCR